MVHTQPPQASPPPAPQPTTPPTATSLHKLQIHRTRHQRRVISPRQQPADSLPAFRAHILRPRIDIHAHESIGGRSIHATPVFHRIANGFFPVRRSVCD